MGSIGGSLSKMVCALTLAVLAVLMMSPATARSMPIWEDALQDVGGLNAVPGVSETGFDLREGSIERKGKRLVFSVMHSALPPTNQPGEAFRLLWHFDIGEKQYRFTFKTVDVGKPDILAGNGEERLGTIYMDGVARLELQYADSPLPIQLEQFRVVEYMDVEFDTQAKKISWAVPLKSLKLRSGSRIEPGTGGLSQTGCQICWIVHVAERSFTARPELVLDSAAAHKFYRVP